MSQSRILRDPKIIPLVFATDVVIGETTMYADYVFPDLSYLEQWASPGDVPQPAVKSNPFRQPAAPPIPEIVTVAGEEMPVSMEAVMLAIADRLELPGFGTRRVQGRSAAQAAGGLFSEGRRQPGFRREGGWHRMRLPEASQEELDSLPQGAPASATAGVRRGQVAGGCRAQICGKRVVYVLNRGGRFEHFSGVYDGDHMAHKFAGTFHLYIERAAKQKDSITGKAFDGLPFYDPPLNSNGRADRR